MAQQKTKHSGHDVIVLEVQQELPGQLREALRPKGFPTHLVSGLVEMVELAEKTPSPVLLFTLNRDLGVAEAFLKELEQHSTLFQFPVLLLGENAESLQDILNRNFALGYCLKLPLATGELISALQHITRSVRMGRLGGAKDTKDQPAVTIESTSTGSTIPEPPKSTLSPAHKVQIVTPKADTNAQMAGRPKAEADTKLPGTSLSQIPAQLFDLIGELGLFTRAVGGECYPLAASEDELIRRAGLPTHYRAMIEEISSQLGSWSSKHLYRTAYVVSAVGNALKLSQKEIDNTRDAALLLAANFKKSDQSLLRKNYLAPEFSTVRRDLGSRMKDSAMKVAIDLGAPDVGQVISATARLLCGEVKDANDSHHIQASIVMGSEFIDRICYQNGSWNPRAAYYLLRKFKQNELSEIHSPTLACLIKLLSEAIASCTLSILIDRKTRMNPALKAEARRLRDEPVLAHEAKIALKELTPGMRLSRPIRAYDGREILADDLILDQDLIWRLWQLAAVRPLNSPVVILTDEQASMASPPIQSRAENLNQINGETHAAASDNTNSSNQDQTTETESPEVPDQVRL